MFETWVFYAFGAVLLVSGLLVITARNPVHGVLFLVLAFFTAAAIWLRLRAEFLAIALVVVYVGAVMVLSLVVMMPTSTWNAQGLAQLRSPWCGDPASRWSRCSRTALRRGPGELPPATATKALGRALYTSSLAFEVAAAAPGGTQKATRCALRTALPDPLSVSAQRTARLVHEGRKVTVDPSHYLVLAAILFAISVVGIFLNRQPDRADGDRAHALRRTPTSSRSRTTSATSRARCSCSSS
jgi:hypothetical protein